MTLLPSAQCPDCKIMISLEGTNIGPCYAVWCHDCQKWFDWPTDGVRHISRLAPSPPCIHFQTIQDMMEIYGIIIVGEDITVRCYQCGMAWSMSDGAVVGSPNEHKWASRRQAVDAEVERVIDGAHQGAT